MFAIQANTEAELLNQKAEIINEHRYAGIINTIEKLRNNFFLELTLLCDCEIAINNNIGSCVIAAEQH